MPDFYSAAQYLLFLVIVTALVKPLGGYMERVFSRQRTALDRLCLPVERIIYRITFVDPDVEMTGKEYGTCFVLFGLAGTLLLYAILRMQQVLPWFFPQYLTTPLSPGLALNTAISFSTTLEPLHVVVEYFLARRTLHLYESHFIRCQILGLHVNPFACLPQSRNPRPALSCQDEFD
jgi:K+-transporting ATPase A subunit